MTGFDPRALLRPELADLEEYVPILPYEALSRKLGIPVESIVKLDANENPWGPLPAVQVALAEYAFYHIYPDPQQTELREALSAFVAAPAANILPSHGADEMLDLLCRVLLAPGDAIINTPPTFGMYEFDASLAGAEVINVTRLDGFAVDVAAIEALIAHRTATGIPLPKILFLTSPNNPTGNWLDDASFERLVNLPLLVVLDEAYVEFADHPSRAPLVTQRDNLVVLRTFSKAAGIAGLRLGYAIAPEWLMATLWTFKQPYNVNVAASVAGIASLRHADQIAAVVDKIKRERARLFDLLSQIPWLRPHPSQANFILCDVIDRDARAVKLALESRGVLIRHYNKPGLQNCLRISVGTPHQIDRLIAELISL
jgi:histidinol-phosphate aminotransferase